LRYEHLRCAAQPLQHLPQMWMIFTSIIDVGNYLLTGLNLSTHRENQYARTQQTSWRNHRYRRFH
jgi:hypothetical protein